MSRMEMMASSCPTSTSRAFNLVNLIWVFLPLQESLNWLSPLISWQTLLTLTNPSYLGKPFIHWQPLHTLTNPFIPWQPLSSWHPLYTLTSWQPLHTLTTSYYLDNFNCSLLILTLLVTRWSIRVTVKSYNSRKFRKSYVKLIRGKPTW